MVALLSPFTKGATMAFLVVAIWLAVVISIITTGVTEVSS